MLISGKRTFEKELSVLLCIAHQEKYSVDYMLKVQNATANWQYQQKAVII